MRSIFKSQRAVDKVLGRKSTSLETHREIWFQVKLKISFTLNNFHVKINNNHILIFNNNYVKM